MAGLRNIVDKGRRSPWIGLGVLWVVGFIGALSRFIMAFYQIQISDDLHIGRGFISLSWSTNLLIAALCAPLGGWMIDRYGVRKVMLLSTTLGIIGTGVVCLGQHPLLFFTGYGVISGLAGIGASATYVLLFSWFSKHRAKAIALIQSASSIGLAVCTPIFAQNAWLSWKVTFLASCLLGLVVTLPLILLFIPHPGKHEASAGGTGDSGAGGRETGVPDRAEGAGGRETGVPDRAEGAGGRGTGVPDGAEGAGGRGTGVPDGAEGAGDKGNRASNSAAGTVPGTSMAAGGLKQLGRSQLAVLTVIGLALFVCGFNMGTVEMNLVAIHQEAGVSQTSIAAGMAILGIMEIVGSFTFGFLLDRGDKTYIMSMLYGIRVLGFMILFAHFSWSPAVFAFAFGITYLGAIPGGLMIADQLAGIKGKLVGTLLLFHQGGGILGALLGGILYDYMKSYQLLIAADAGLATLAAAGYILVRRYRSRPLAGNREAQA
ncbi:MFS transporter [Paenibacillus sp. YPG26]|uniref:MFS transporter n=1 Tax=Paenibacillus sp. YPG26 TaxID=2878915 RepID=UPI00203D75D0|nr:MFS transporter [Paenibacillus sp. YPG26]USB33040.1 MFS transporter [Paenibacillus sp. YPG26]